MKNVDKSLYMMSIGLLFISIGLFALNPESFYIFLSTLNKDVITDILKLSFGLGFMFSGAGCLACGVAHILYKGD